MKNRKILMQKGLKSLFQKANNGDQNKKMEF